MSSDQFTWTVVVTPDALPFLHRRFLGLTFFERRLREAKRLGASHVFIEVVGRNSTELPSCNESHCASWSFLEGNSVNENRSANYRVPLLGLIEKKAPFAVEFEIHNDSEWIEAQQFYRQKIVNESGAGWVALYINKRISFAISQVLAFTKLTPNQWSYFNLLVGLASGVFVAQSEWVWVLMGGLFFQLASVFDGVDGEIAKFRLEYSAFGAKLDTFVDNISLLAFFVGAFVHWIRSGTSSIATVVIIPTISLILMVTLVGRLFFFVHHKLNAGSLVAYDKGFLDHLPKSDPVVRLSQVGRYFIKKDFFSMLFFVFCLFNHVEWVFYSILVGTFVGTLGVLYLNNRYGKTHYVSSTT